MSTINRWLCKLETVNYVALHSKLADLQVRLTGEKKIQTSVLRKDTKAMPLDFMLADLFF